MAYSRSVVFARVSAELDRNPASTLADLAAGLRIHRHTVTEVVRATTGMHFRAWRDRRLFERSCVLLLDRGTRSIKEISALAGFSSTRAFDRFVKRHTGRPPTEMQSVPANANGSPSGPPVHHFDKRSSKDR